MLRELFEQINLTGQTVQVSNGGTGAATAADARTNLSVYSTSETDALIAQGLQERAVWGYQDFSAGVITSTSVTLTANSNGTSAVFDVAKLISSSASLFRQDGISYAFTGTSSLFSSKITVASQVGATITLSGIPNASWGTVRIWYQILSTVYPQNYQNPPLTVQTTVVTALGALFEEQENKATDFTVLNDVLYPSTLAVSTALALKQNTNTVLTNLSNAAYAADTLVYATGINTFSITTLTAAARTVLGDNDVAAMVNTLGGATSTGSGGLVRATSPALVAPALGTPGSGNLGNCVGYASVNLPTGTCLKVVSTSKIDTASTTSSTYAAITGLSATITPVNSSSKILVRVILSVGGSALTKANFQLFRDTTQIGGGSAPGVRISDSAVLVSSGSTTINSFPIEFLDSPVTGSAVVYSVKWSSPDNGSTVYLNRAFVDTSSALISRTISTITLTEIKG